MIGYMDWRSQMMCNDVVLENGVKWSKKMICDDVVLENEVNCIRCLKALKKGAVDPIPLNEYVGQGP